ncbi:MAG: CHASE2 domain-containing protein, partial [Zavarzinia sp.]|nr:CHASE2 domain-containing protein [Zavarzinia sp.]
MSGRLLPLPLFALVLALALAVTFGATPLRPRDAGIDALFATVPAAPTDTVAVVDIDGAALALHGPWPWPWPRGRIAALLDALWQRGARVVAFDIAFVGPDRRSAAAVVADLPAAPDKADRAVLERLFPDGDALLAQAMAGGDAVLGLLADPSGEAPPPPAPPFHAGAVLPAAPARVAGLTPPFAPLLDQSAATGVMALGLDGAGVIRDVPLLVALPRAAFGGLALEAARVSLGYPEIVLAGDARLGLGSLSLPIDGRALLRLHAQGAAAERARTVRAAALLDGTAPAEGIAGRIVLVGSSSPALGALRAVPGNPYRPSVQIQADAVGQILAGVNYIRSPAALVFDGLAVIAAVLGALVAARRLPVPAGVAAIAAGAVVLVGAAALLVLRG